MGRARSHGGEGSQGPLEGKYDLGFHFSAEWEDERCEAEKQEPVWNTPNTAAVDLGCI